MGELADLAVACPGELGRGSRLSGFVVAGALLLDGLALEPLGGAELDRGIGVAWLRRR